MSTIPKGSLLAKIKMVDNGQIKNLKQLLFYIVIIMSHIILKQNISQQIYCAHKSCNNYIFTCGKQEEHFHFKSFIWLIIRYQCLAVNSRQNLSNRNIAHSRFDCKIIHCYTSYLHYDGQNGTRSGKSNETDKNFEYLQIFEPCNKSEDNCIVNRKFTSRFNRLRGKRGWVYVIFFELCIKGNPFARLE